MPHIWRAYWGVLICIIFMVVVNSVLYQGSNFRGHQLTSWEFEKVTGSLWLWLIITGNSLYLDIHLTSKKTGFAKKQHRSQGQTKVELLSHQGHGPVTLTCEDLWLEVTAADHRHRRASYLHTTTCKFPTIWEANPYDDNFNIPLYQLSWWAIAYGPQWHDNYIVSSHCMSTNHNL